MKFLLFADLHIHATWPISTNKELHVMQKRAEEEGCDFIIHAGDLCFDAAANRDIIEEYNSFHIPSYHVLGNHDMDKLSLEETVAAYGMPAEYYYFDKNGFRFIVLNENYFRYEDEDIPYSKGNYYKFGPYRDYISRPQVAWLEETHSPASSSAARSRARVRASSQSTAILLGALRPSRSRPSTSPNRKRYAPVVRERSRPDSGLFILTQ